MVGFEKAGRPRKFQRLRFRVLDERSLCDSRLTIPTTILESVLCFGLLVQALLFMASRSSFSP